MLLAFKWFYMSAHLYGSYKYMNYKLKKSNH